MPCRKIIRIFSPVILFLGAVGFTITDDTITDLTRRLAEWSDKHPIEKAYLHFDKPYYTAGDDIWFKAYVLTGPDRQLQPDSGILNVELINDADSIKQTLKIQLHNGLGYGDIPLPDTLPEGNYRIRAYTQYMRNAGSQYFFDKAIVIGNVITNRVFTTTTFTYQQKQVTATIRYTDANGAAYANKQVNYNVFIPAGNNIKGKAVTNADGVINVVFPVTDLGNMDNARIITTVTGIGENKTIKTIPVRFMAGVADVQFFPEGGEMVNGLLTNLAFKVIGNNGLGVEAKGIVRDKNGKQVAVINTTHLGMGVFSLTPQAGQNYKAELTYADGSKASVALPNAKDNGLVLNVVTVDPNRVIVNITSAKPITQTLNLLAQENGKVCFAAKSTIGRSSFSTVIPVSKFPSGIVKFTLFSATGEPLNQRLVFVHGNDQLDIKVAPDAADQQARKPVTLNFEAKTSDGKPSLSSLSVAVTNESKVPVDENNENNIFASLLLSADIKGYIEQPAYYFNSIDAKKRADLDVLMMTQGYHRFEWRQVASGADVTDKFPDEKTFTISGRVTTNSGQPVNGGKVELINFGDGVLQIDTVTDANGRFSFNDIIYPDSIKFLLQARTAKNKRNVVITLDTIPPPSASQFKNLPDFLANPGEVITPYAQNSRQYYYEQMRLGIGNHVIPLQEVQIREKRNALKHSANLNGPGNADQVILAKDLYQGCIQLADCLQGRLLGVYFRNGVAYSTRGGGQMLIVVDGVYTDSGYMNTLNVNDVQSIEVLRNIGKAAIYGTRANGGVLIITTKRGDEPVEYPKYFGGGVTPYAPKGIYKSRSFYSPKYDVKRDVKLADLRSTIFWKPDLVTVNGKTSASYYNGAPGKYRVVVEGIGTDGRIGRQIFRYTVK